MVQGEGPLPAQKINNPNPNLKNQQALPRGAARLAGHSGRSCLLLAAAALFSGGLGGAFFCLRGEGAHLALPGPIPTVKGGEASGEEIDTGLHVCLVSHFDALVHVAHGDGNRTGNGATGHKLLHGAGICTTGGEELELVGDGVLLAEGGLELDHAAVGDEGAIVYLNGGTLAEDGALIVSAGAGGIEGDGDIEREGEIRLDGDGGGLGTTQAYLLLHGEDGIQVVVRQLLGSGNGADSLDEQEATATVVDALYVEAIAHLDEVADAGDGVADGNILLHFFLGHAEVDHVVGNGGHFGALLGSHDVDGLNTHAAGQILGAVHRHALGGEGLGVEPTEGEDANEAVVVDMANDEADFIHVGGAHDFFVAALALNHGDNIAHVVDGDGICQRGHLFDDEITDAVLKTGSPGSLTKFLEELDIHDAQKDTPELPDWQDKIEFRSLDFEFWIEK